MSNTLNRRHFLRNVSAAISLLRTLDLARATSGIPGEPISPVEFKHMGVLDVWAKYDGALTWGKGQCLAILDDGCKLNIPEWQTSMPWGKKVVAVYDVVDSDDDPTPLLARVHGTTVGFPSSLNYGGKFGIAFNDFVAHIRAVTAVHLKRLEAESIAAGLRWVVGNHQRLRITAVNLSPVDDQRHKEPAPTAIDEPLRRVRELGIWVSAPCANNNYTDGISWPACQPDCFAIGAVKPAEDQVYLDRHRKTALLVPAGATSSSNAFAVACAMILREAIEKNEVRLADSWRDAAGSDYGDFSENRRSDLRRRH